MIRAASLALLLATAPAMAEKYNFNYAMAGADAIGLVRTFDDGKNTVLAFEGSAALTNPTITTVDGTILHYKSISRYAVLPGLQRHVLVYTKGLVAHVRYAPDAGRRFSPPTTVTMAPAPSWTPVPADNVAPRTFTPQHQAQSAASAPTATSPSPGVQQHQPAPPTHSPAAPTIALADAAADGVAAVGKPTHSTALGSVVTPAASASASATSVADAPLPPPQPSWTAGNGTTLRGSVEEWSAKAQWTVVWDAGVDYPITGSLKYEGTYLDAIRGIFLAHSKAERPLRADLYTSQKLIHITE